MRRLLSQSSVHAAVSLGLCVPVVSLSDPQQPPAVPAASPASDKPPAPARCPFAHLWEWTGSLSLPFGHPSITDIREDPVEYNKSHYPSGLNAIFLSDDVKSYEKTFAGDEGLLENPQDREIVKYANNIISTLQEHGLRRGSSVADIGAGTGYITRMLVSAVGTEGEVWAQEISPGFMSMLEKMKTNEDLENMHIIEGNVKDCGLPVDSLDLVLVCDVYHHFEYPRTMCRSIHSALKKGPKKGRLAVIDFHRDDSKIWSRPKGWVMEHVRGNQEDFRKEIESAGFRLVSNPAIPGITENYCMIFEPV